MAANSGQDLSRAPWRKSSYSGNGNNCVEVAAAGGIVGVRDTTDRAGMTAVFSTRPWQQFTAQVKRGDVQL